MNDDVRPFELHVEQAALDDLRDRLARTRWPERETVASTSGVPDWSQGPPLSYVEQLVDAWWRTYDWRRVEGELNTHGQALTEIDSLDIHFLHLRSPRPDARPLILTHGWPSSVIEPLEVMDALAHPRATICPRSTLWLLRCRDSASGVSPRRPVGMSTERRMRGSS